MTQPVTRLHDTITRRVPLWVGDAIAAAFIVAAPFIPVHGASLGNLAAYFVAIIPAALLPLRRRWPKTVLLACLLLYPVAVFWGVPAPGIVIAIAIATFGVANRSTRRTTLVVGVLTVIAIAMIALFDPAAGIVDPRVFQVVITVAFAAAAGDATRSRREFIQAMTGRAERAEATKEAEAKRRVAEERVRIARDLHDVMAHQIAVISLNAGVASSTMASQPEKAEESLSTIRTAARTVLGEIGDLLEVLRADEPSDASPQPGLARLADLERPFAAAGLAITVRVDGDLSAVPTAADLVAYRVVQEGLTNAHKHGAEHRAHVLIEAKASMLSVVITNPAAPVGRRAASDSEAIGSGLGLVGLRERVSAVHGTVETGPFPGGWRLAAVVPLNREELSR
ncbi:sensor histidine kinase [Microbacterium marmarense]|uniref:histidine kinase n=1 Tax=Microbacterium marmarense TaxID=3122051 RepID=A0ABU8LRD6_9MICO